MKWTKEQLKFLKENPEVFEKAEDPSELARKIGSFTAYHFNEGEIAVLVLAWAEVRGLIDVMGSVDYTPLGNKALRLYLSGPGVDNYKFLTVQVYANFSKDQIIEAIKSRFESEYLFSLSDLPVLEHKITYLIKR
jgi:hypothetical protein